MPIKSIPIELDKQRHLRFDFNAFCELEGQMGLSMTNIGEILSSGSAGFKEMRALVWAGLLHEDESLTVKDIGKILEDCNWFDNIADIMSKVTDALNAAIPTIKAGEKNAAGSKPEKEAGKNT